MQIEKSMGLVINAPEFFQNEAFLAWLNNGARKLTWHNAGDTPGEFSDVLVLVDPSLNGEGSDSDMPEQIWDAILDACRAHYAPGLQTHLTVRLTNLDA